MIVLINSDAISQSEHTRLCFQETAGSTFIGSPTAGANGDITVMRLPGGARMSLTGQEVKHVDGTQARKDELLDRALAFLTTGR